MSTDGPSPNKPAFLAGPFGALTRLILRHPGAVIAAGLALAAVCGLLSVTQLGYRTSRLDLLNPNSDYNRLWIEYLQEFGDDDDAVVVVEGTGRSEVVPVLDELSAELAREQRLFHGVLHEVNLSRVRSKGLHYLPPDQLLGIDRYLNEVSPVLAGNWARLGVGQVTDGLMRRIESAARQPGADRAGSAELDRLTGSLLATLSGRGGYQSPWPEMPEGFTTLSELNSNYLLANQGKLGFVLLRLAKSDDDFTRNSAATDALRAVVADVQARHPQVKIGLTGLPIMENDEMRSSQTSMLWASIVSFVGVGLIFVAGFGGLRHALLANAVLLVGMAWAFGFVTLSVGHLNILSVTFTVTLIGLGIDYGVYYIARYLQHRGEGQGCHDALVSTSRGVGPAVTAAALTTSFAFFSAAFTSFSGVAELGIIAGGGLLLCAAAELVILPAAVLLMDRGQLGRTMPRPLPVQRWIAPALRWPRLTLTVCAALVAVASLGLSRLWYDNNLLNMQAVGLESVELERKLLSEGSQSAWYALSVANSPDELLRRKAQFLRLRSVERTEEIVSLLPSDHRVKQPIIHRIQDRLATLPERPPLIPVERPERLGQRLGELQELLERGGVAGKSVRNLEQIRDLLRRMPVSDCYAQLAKFQQQMAGDLLSRLFVIRGIADPEPPKLSDLPGSLVDRFVGRHGKCLLKIYGKGNIWDTQALARFVADVRSVDPRATGNPLQAHEASLEMRRSYQQAAVYSLLIIVGVLLFDLRNLRHAALAALPLSLGMGSTFGLMGWLDIPLNPANLIALPLLLGIGVDYGVHIVHEFREHAGPYQLSPGTAVAVLVDALTTIVGFGSLMVASHQGLQSLGRVLTLGVTCCLFTSLLVLPALLVLLTRDRRAPPAAAAQPEPIALAESPTARIAA